MVQTFADLGASCDNAGRSYDIKLAMRKVLSLLLRLEFHKSQQGGVGFSTEHLVAHTVSSDPVA